MRIQKITIDSPISDQEIWVHLEIQKITYNDNGDIVSINPRAEFISRPFSKFVTQMFNFNDPVLQKNISVSGAGLSKSVMSAAITWIIEDTGASVDSEGLIWL